MNREKQGACQTNIRVDFSFFSRYRMLSDQNNHPQAILKYRDRQKPLHPWPWVEGSHKQNFSIGEIL
jgi:hypothetical protein